MTSPSRTWIRVVEELNQQADTAHCLANQKNHPDTPLKVVFQASIKKPIRKSELNRIVLFGDFPPGLRLYVQDRLKALAFVLRSAYNLIFLIK